MFSKFQAILGGSPQKLLGDPVPRPSRRLTAVSALHPKDFFERPIGRVPDLTVLQPVASTQTTRRALEAQWLERCVNQLSPQERSDVYRARSLMMTGHPSEAEDLLRPIVKGPGSHLQPLHCFLGEALRMQGKLQESFEKLNICTLGWTNITSVLPYAITCWALEEKREALYYVGTQCKIRDGHPMPWFVRGIFLCLDGQQEQGIRHLEMAEALSGGHELAKYCVDFAKRAKKSGSSHAVDCGIEPLKIPCCLGA